MTIRAMDHSFNRPLFLGALIFFVSLPFFLHGAEAVDSCAEKADGDYWLGRWSAESHYRPEQTTQVWRWWFEVVRRGQGHRIRTHSEGADKTEVVSIDPDRLEFLFHDVYGTRITATRDGEHIIGTLVQPQNRSLPSGWIIGQRVFDPCSHERETDPPAGEEYDLNGDWVYGESGSAEIIHEMGVVRILMTWGPSQVPAPHYEVYASTSGRWLVGQWKYVSSEQHSLQTAGRFQAEVGEDGNSIRVSKTLDNDHSFNGIVFTRSARR
ncbi:MAG: hypothetical protein AB2659_06650 [Candidatus Thiodiazotropha sp.]